MYGTVDRAGRKSNGKTDLVVQRFCIVLHKYYHLFMSTCQNRTINAKIRLTNLVLTLPFIDCVCITMNFEAFLFERPLESKYISALIAPFFDSRIKLLRAPSVGSGYRKDSGMDREGSINHDPLILSFARFKLTKLDGLISGIVERRSVPRVDIDDIDDRVSVVSRYEGGGSCC